jgi:hypothetical protein
MIAASLKPLNIPLTIGNQMDFRDHLTAEMRGGVSLAAELGEASMRPRSVQALLQGLSDP